MADADEVHCRADEDMLEMWFCFTEVARLPQVEGAHALRERPLDPRPWPIRPLKLLGGLAFPRGLEREVFVLAPNRQHPATISRMRALLPTAARATVGRRKLDLDNRLAPRI